MSSLANDPRVRPGAACKVRRRGFTGQAFTWVDGTFKEVHGKGAFVITAKDGNSNFYHWNEIEVTYAPSPPTMKPSLATLGDALPALARLATPDRSQIAVAAEPPPAPRPAPPAPRPSTPPLSQARQRAPSTRHLHQPTAIGTELRRARDEDGQTQATASKALGISATRLSNIETGAIIPSDDELVLFSAHYDLPLEELEALADAPPPVTAAPAGPVHIVQPAPADDYVRAIAAVIEALSPLTIAERRAILQPLLRIL